MAGKQRKPSPFAFPTYVFSRGLMKLTISSLQTNLVALVEQPKASIQKTETSAKRKALSVREKAKPPKPTQVRKPTMTKKTRSYAASAVTTKRKKKRREP
jgi:hypothetical protein